MLVNVMWIVYGIQILHLTQKAKMSATGWPMSTIYLSVVIGGFYGTAMSLYRILKGGF